MMYFSASQFPIIDKSEWSTPTISTPILVSPIKDQIAALDSDQAVSDIGTMEEESLR